VDAPKPSSTPKPPERPQQRSQTDASSGAEPSAGTRESVEKETLVQSFLDVFKGEIAHVKDVGKTGDTKPVSSQDNQEPSE
jgi:hypothetical protein